MFETSAVYERCGHFSHGNITTYLKNFDFSVEEVRYRSFRHL